MALASNTPTPDREDRVTVRVFKNHNGIIVDGINQQATNSPFRLPLVLLTSGDLIGKSELLDYAILR
jgi:hypothetical protein